MIALNNSEFKGTLQEISFADLLAETCQSGLSGSFRLAHQEEKSIIYLNNGEIVFGVSNLRQHRLFEMLLQTNKVTKETLTEIPNFTNDLELAEILIDREIVTRTDIEVFFCQTISEIIKNALSWQTGAWNFSHLSRAKEGIHFKIDTTAMLLDYARNLPAEIVIQKFRSLEERFTSKGNISDYLGLLPQEAFILSRLAQTVQRISEIKNISGLPNQETLKILYALWLGGYVTRKNFNSAFSDNQLQHILSAKLTLKKEALSHLVKQNVPAESDAEDIELELDNAEVETDEQKLLEQYLTRVETAQSYYEILNVPIKAPVVEIKTAYFKLAKNYHPDRFHQESNSSLQQRVQNAFTEIARAYETLKDEKARETYDFKLRKYLEAVQSQQATSNAGEKPVINIDRAREEFDQGFDYLMAEQYEESIPFLARAAQMSPDSARYHAYYGKALAMVGNQRHKAESELHTAIKLESNTPTYRIMLAEFYIQYNLLKRAEGELQRLLSQFPNNKEAQVLLDSLAK